MKELKQKILRIVLPLVRLYWKIFRPKTYGVKVLLVHGENILLVQHSYGNRSRWQIPGGGYHPNKEGPEAAAKRELLEEIGVSAQKLLSLSEYYSESEGKRDTVTIFCLDLHNPSNIQKSAEIHDATWVNWEDALKKWQITQITRYAIESAFSKK